MLIAVVRHGRKDYVKTILLVYMAFHFDAGATSSQTVFETSAKCEAAKAVITREFMAREDSFGRKRFAAFCVGV